MLVFIFLYFGPFTTVIDHFLHNGHTSPRAKYVETASPVMCIHFLAVNSTCIYSSLERCTNHGLSCVSGALCLIVTIVKLHVWHLSHALQKQIMNQSTMCDIQCDYFFLFVHTTNKTTQHKREVVQGI